MRHNVPHFTSKISAPRPSRGGAGGGVRSYTEVNLYWPFEGL